jgi:DNA-binding helix-hairpin-helix protein with protein kinase domain
LYVGTNWGLTLLGTLAAVLWFGRPGAQQEFATRKQRALTARAAFDQAYQELNRAATNAPFLEALGRLEKMKADLLNQRARYDAELAELIRNREKAERTKFLDSFEIRSAQIQGFGDKRKADLLSFGIETALDITDAVYRIPGIKVARAQALFAWKRSVEAKFRFDPKKGLDAKILAEFKSRYIEKRKEGKSRLLNAPYLLEGIKQDLIQKVPALRQTANEMADAMWQAEADMRSIWLLLTKR